MEQKTPKQTKKYSNAGTHTYTIHTCRVDDIANMMSSLTQRPQRCRERRKAWKSVADMVGNTRRCKCAVCVLHASADECSLRWCHGRARPRVCGLSGRGRADGRFCSEEFVNITPLTWKLRFEFPLQGRETCAGPEVLMSKHTRVFSWAFWCNFSQSECNLKMSPDGVV